MREDTSVTPSLCRVAFLVPMDKQLKKIREMVEELLVEDFNDIFVTQTLRYIDTCIDSVENNV